MGALGDEQLVGDAAGLLLDRADLVHQDHGVDHDAVADDVDGVLAEDARRDGVQHEAVAVEDQGMACVGTTLETRNYFVVRGQDIDHLAFALVAPLEPEHDIDFLHINNNQELLSNL